MSAEPIRNSEQDEIIRLLKSSAFFSDASDEVLAFAVEHGEEIFFQRGEGITLEREFNNNVYFIIQGSVEIVSFLPEENRIERRALLRAGQQFGEFSILTNSTRSGSVYAFEDSTLYRLPGPAFLAILESSADLIMKLVTTYASLNQDFERKTEIVPYRALSELKVSSQLASIFPAASWEKHGAIPISKREGVLEVAVMDPHNQAFFRFAKQTVSVTQFVLSLIPEADFGDALTAAKTHLKRGMTTGEHKISNAEVEVRAEAVVSALKRSPLYRQLPEDVLQQIAQNIPAMKVSAGHVILKSGEDVPYNFVVVSGKVELLQSLPSIDAEMGAGQTFCSRIATLSAGEDFGDVQLVLKSKSNYVVQTLEDTFLIPIPQDYFQQLMAYPAFALPLAAKLAKRLQMLGHIAGVKFLKEVTSPDWKSVATLIPVTVLAEEKVMPVRVQDQEVVLCAVSSDNSHVSNRVSRYLGRYRIKQFNVRPAQFSEWLTNLKSVVEAGSEPSEKTASLRLVKGADAKVDIIKWIDTILLLGMKNRASDIHFEPTEDRLQVRFRIDGVLREHAETLPHQFAREVVNRLKIMAEMDISLQFVPQDGQLKTKVGDVDILARVSCVPVRNGEKFVLRLVRSQSSVVPLAMIAPDRRIANILNGVTKCKQGLFLVTGPTGSGKTTTLYSLLNAINDVGVNVTTLEDPVEMEIQGLSQIEIDYKRGLDFHKALRSVLRQDPNVIMVGEIRDEESAKIVFDASITGHLVLSTLHTTSSLDIVPRLIELGVSPANISAGLVGVLTQRLLRANCKKCLTTRPATPAEREIFKRVLGLENPPEELAHGAGCPACAGTGYLHRVPVLEVWRSTSAMRQAILEKRGQDDLLTKAREDGFETLLESALKLVLSGLTNLEEVRRVLGGF